MQQSAPIRSHDHDLCNSIVRNWLLLIVIFAFGMGLQSSVAQEATQINTDQSGPKTDIPIRGIVKASARAELSTEISARVTKIGFKEGQLFQKDDLLIAFDCRRQNAELASRKALLKEFSINLRSAVYLKKRNAGNRHDLDIARARVEKAKADAASTQTQLNECSMYAPFSGRIASLHIHEHEIPASGKPLLTIVSMHEPQIEIVVPSSWLSWLKSGSEFKFHIHETGKSYQGQMVRPGAVVSTVSHTIKIFARFSGNSKDVLPGMSGTVEFEKWLMRM